ncbi:MAG: hypothetical protein CL927_06475 [Deltaproteobacteria bacterium]|nr:hypothetical protein [Deltaproteobacteria bacterium]
MATFLVTLALIGFAMMAMAVGVIFSNRRLHGSCGGSSEDCVCEIEKRRACHASKQMVQALAKRRAGGDVVDAVLLAGIRAETQQPQEL